MSYLKIRKIVTNNRSGDVYGITIPYSIAEFYQDIEFRIIPQGNNILLQSGTYLKLR